jgi:adenosylcobinamide-GDP ribazoletransferase
MWNQLGIALSFLTVFRLPFASLHNITSEDLARSFSFFPLGGLLLGACCSALGYLFHSRVPPLLLAVLITALLTILTRGLHLDGLADLADGVGGSYDPERRLEIMKDSNIGAFGSLALVLAIAFKIAAIYALIATESWSSVLLIPALSRLAMVLSAYRIPYARSKGGLAKPFLEFITPRQPLIAGGFSLVFSFLLESRLAPVYLIIMMMNVGILRHLARRWLGGVTGDVLGAINEVTEVTLFSLAACLV